MQYNSSLANPLNFAANINFTTFTTEAKICHASNYTMHVLRNTYSGSAAHRNTNVEQIPIMYNFYCSDGDYIGKMLDEFGLINMNGRCYDPVVGRFLSPDIIVQNPNNTQCYNRYSYAINNPLKYSDPSGWSWTPIQAANHANMMAMTMTMRLQDNFHPTVIRSGSSSRGNGYLFGSNAIVFQNAEATLQMALGDIAHILSTVFGIPGLFGNPSSIDKIDITGMNEQDFSEAFLGVSAYERFFGDGIFKMNEYFIGSNDAKFSFVGNVVMNRGDYEYNAYITANFKLTDEINLNNMEFHAPEILSMDLSGATIVPGGASIENQQQDILNFSLFCSVKFNDGIEYSAFNFYGGTLDDYARKSNPMLTNDGDRLIDGLTYRFDSSHIKQAKYYFNNFSSSFGYNWWYRY